MYNKIGIEKQELCKTRRKHFFKEAWFFQLFFKIWTNFKGITPNIFKLELMEYTITYFVNAAFIKSPYGFKWGIFLISIVT